MKANYFLPIVFAACLVAANSCSSDSPDGDTIKKGKENVSTPIANDNDLWTYYSLEKNKPVGTSRFGNAEQDKQWAARGDWDIAVCGDLIRTNSGTSGNWQGGIQESQKDYSTLKTAPEEGFETDVYE